MKFILKVKYFLASCDRQPGTPSLTLTWHACKYRYVSDKLHQRYILCTYCVHQRMYLWWSLYVYTVFIGMPGESYCGQLRSLLLYLCDIFQALSVSLVLASFPSCKGSGFSLGTSAVEWDNIALITKLNTQKKSALCSGSFSLLLLVEQSSLFV